MSGASTAQRDVTNPLSMLPSHLDLYYAGQWRLPMSGRYVEAVNPALDTPLAKVAYAGMQDADAAIRAAHGAFGAWRDLSPQDRAAMMRKAAAILREHAEELALLDALNTGNPIADMTGDARAAAAGMEGFAGLANEMRGATMPAGSGALDYSMREPLGVVARIIAHDHPLAFAAVKIGAPLVAGNTVVVKAPEQAPMSALRMAELVGGVFPPGVLNVLAGGEECSRALCVHPLVRKVTLIGSAPSGKAVMRAAAETLKPVLLELGARTSVVAYADADVDSVIAALVRGMSCTWAGHASGSTNRAFLHEAIHDAVLDGAVAQINKHHKLGLPTDWSTTMGPLASRAQYDEAMQAIESARVEGARLVIGGKRPGHPELAKGFFIEPTVFADVKPTMRIAREEISGPVLSVFAWSDENAMLQDVNAVEYGLNASIWTRDLATAHRAAARVKAGRVSINQAVARGQGASFGGARPTGAGRDASVDELLAFTQIKNVTVSLDQPPTPADKESHR